MSERSLVKYTAACPACQQDVEWTAMPVSVNSPAWTSQNRCGIEVRLVAGLRLPHEQERRRMMVDMIGPAHPNYRGQTPATTNRPPNDWPIDHVEAIRDGDTGLFHVNTGLGHDSIEGRLNGIDCPEGNAPGGPEAAEFSRQWMADRAGWLRLRAHVTRTGRHKQSFGRTIVDVYDVRDNTSLADALRAAGHVKATTT